MALYLGNLKVTPSITNTIIRTITLDLLGDTISDITDTTYTTLEDPDNQTSDLPTVTEWTRPSGWPNLDNLPALTEGVYLTFDNRSTVDYKWAGFMCRCNTGSYRVAQGHVSGNTWTQDAYWDIASGSYKEVDYHASSYDFVVFKITPASTNHITEFYFARIPLATLGTIILRPQLANRCLERVGKLPYLTTTNGSGRGDNHAYCCEWMEHDNVEFGNALTNLAVAWYRGRSLKKIEFGNWTGENCNITSLDTTFGYCNNIEKIDLSLWKTHNWHVTTIAGMFQYCFNMKICNVPFDTTNWGSGAGRTLQMHITWYNCHSLESLDLSSWNMAGINVTVIYLCWYQCFHLKSLNVKNWNTSSWTVNGTYGLYHLFGSCRRLVDIDLSGWNTSNWRPVRADCIFYNNQRRRNFDDIKYWNVSGWPIKLFSDAFGSCYTVQELDLSHWNVTNWLVTTLSAIFANMYSVRHIKVGTWNTTNWRVTNINYLFLNCQCLEELECWTWDTSNWPVTNGLYYMFGACYRIKEIDFTRWNTTNFALGADGKCDIRGCFQYCYGLRKINMSNINVDAMNSLNYYSYNAAGSRSYSPFYYCYVLEELTLPQHYKGHLDLTEVYLLPRTEIVKAFNAMDTAMGTTAKIWIYGMRYKLTTADIAIATNKGYTVVQS